jgi:hypothetical protein|tara:strand:- start:9162 stop:9761 length:600 start_codon:yes stop_codon:yes gene_type:complete
MAYSGFKGIGPRKLGCGDKGGSPLKKHGAMKGDQSKSRSDYSMDSGATDKGYKGSDGSSKGDQSASRADYSPAKKMNSGMSYDIKEASDQSLSKSARKHYAENAQAANKGGYGNKEKGSPAKQTAKQKANLPKQIVDAIAAKSPAKQVKSRKEMKYDKTAQKAENAVSKDNMGKNSRLIDKANKLNKKNNLGKENLAKG